jgi:site-specific DNA-methyltransferase (cytosine-N4-specific)
MSSQELLVHYDAGNTDPYGISEYDWSFRGVNTSPGTHGLHDYPARMIPQIVRQLIDHWVETGVLSEGDTIYDPFCGSGTTLTEARKAGFHAVGTDINPFACLLARTKATPIEPRQVKVAAQSIFDDWHIHQQFIRDTADANSLDEPTAVKSSWFPEPQRYELDSMARRLSEARSRWDYQVVRFLRICLAGVVREVSYQQDGEFKRQRISEEQRADHNPDVWQLFCEELMENISRLTEYNRTASSEGSVSVKRADCRSPSVLDSNSVSAVITSPPYGDSSTTVAYGQYSRSPALAATPLGVEVMRDVDPEGLGGTRSGAFTCVSDVIDYSESLMRTLDELKSRNGRHDDALDFFADYFEALNQLARVVQAGGPTAIVVGNRTMSRVPIPTHQITVEFLEALGFTVRDTTPRSIPSKTLPWENAPENEAGNSGELIADEYVIVSTAPETSQY